jgi:alpha-D-ribose 1-methylphosphonate 5-triphosphate diphosphatase
VDELTARSAMQAGSEVVMGSPNVVRGASHAKRMTAMNAIRGGYCSILTSDYFYPSILYAAFRIKDEGVLSLPDAWKLVAENPAHAAGLADRGRIAPGLRADLLAVDDSVPGHPRIAATIVGGEIVYWAEPVLLGTSIHELTTH